MKKYILYVTLASIAILAITNPNPKDYYYYSMGKYGRSHTFRKSNFILFSIYQTGNGQIVNLGIIGNYIELPL